MTVYKITVNGRLMFIAGQEDWSILSTHITASRNNGALRFRHGGVEDDIKLAAHDLSREDVTRHVTGHVTGHGKRIHWQESDLMTGDRVEIEIFDADATHVPGSLCLGSAVG